MTSIDDIPTVDDVLKKWSGGQVFDLLTRSGAMKIVQNDDTARSLTKEARSRQPKGMSRDEYYDQFRSNSAQNVAKRTTAQKERAAQKQAQAREDWLSGKQEQRRQERIKNFSQAMRDTRKNHLGKTKWKPNQATVWQWANEQSDTDYLDFSGASTCFAELYWHAEKGEKGPDAMGVMMATFQDGSQYSYVVPKSVAVAWGSGSEGGWWNSDGRYLYNAYL